MNKYVGWINRSLVVYLIVGGLIYVTIDHQQATIKILNHDRNAARYVNRHALRPDVEFDEAKFYKAGEYQRRLIKLLPDEYLSHGVLGYIYYQLGDIPRAIRSYQRAARVRPELFGFHYNLGLIHFQNQDWEQAVASFDKALAAGPTASIEHHQVIARQMLDGPNQQAWIQSKAGQLKQAYELTQLLRSKAQQRQGLSEAENASLYYYVPEMETGIKPLDVIVNHRKTGESL